MSLKFENPSLPRGYEVILKVLLPSSQSEHKVKSRFLLDIVIREGSTILKLLSSENESLLIRRNAFLVLDFGLHIGDSIRRLHIKSNRLSSKSLNKDLHATSQSKHQVQSRLLLDIVIRKSTAILQLFTSKDKTLLIRWNTFLVLDLGFDVRDSVRGFDIERDRLSCQGFDENLHSSSESQYQVECRLLLDVVIRKSSSIFKLFPCKDQSLLVGWNSFLILNLSFHI